MTTLQDIVQEHQAILLDSSILCGPLNRVAGEEEKQYYESLRAFLVETRTLATQSKAIHITQGVFDQLTRERLEYRKIVGKGKYHRNNTERLTLQSRKRADDKRRKLVHYLQHNDNCLNYTQPQALGFTNNLVYEDLSQRMQGLIPAHNLSDTNYEFLMCALTLAEQGTSTAMLSNNNRIRRAWNDALTTEHERITPQTQSYYWMPEAGVFRKEL